MTPITSMLLPIGLAAVAVFMLTMVLHMMPWHRRDYVKLPAEDDVMKALRAFNIPPNDYVVPHPGSGKEMASPEYDARRNAGPVMWLTVLPSGPWNIGKIMGLWFLFVLVVSTSVAWIVGGIVPPGGDAHAVFHCAALIAFLTYAMGAVPMSIWHDRKWSTTFKHTVDSLLYALVTGWIFSMFWLAAPPVRAQSPVAIPTDGLMDKMTGQWVMTGTIGKHTTTHDVDAEWMLKREYIWIHEVSRDKGADGGIGYEAWIHLVWDPKANEYAVMWLDNTAATNFAASGVGHATPDGDRMPFVFRDPDGTGIRTTFAYNRANDSWAWTIDNVDASGKSSAFARLTLTRK